MTVVLDTNVLVSAALKENAVPRRALEWAFRRATVLVSAATRTELRDVLGRPRLDRFVSREVRAVIFARVVFLSVEIDIAEPVVACRDPKDDKFLELAVNGRADYLVTGDLDLLVLDPFRGVRILTPADFLAAVEPPEPVSPIS